MITSLKIFADRFRDWQIERPIANDDPAEGRLLVGREGFHPRLAQVRIASHPARVGVLENRDGRFREFVDQVSRGGDVEEVVKGTFL